MLKTKLFGETYEFKGIKDLMNRASTIRQGDILYERAARSNQERVAAKAVLSNVLVKDIYEHPAVPYEDDEITRLIQDQVNTTIFNEIKNKPLGELREWMLDIRTSGEQIIHASKGMTSEIISALAKLMDNLDLVTVTSKIHHPRHCNTTIGEPGYLSSRLQPNDSRDDIDAMTASTFEGLSYGCGDCMVAINPVEDNVSHLTEGYIWINDMVRKIGCPTQTCILSHITTQVECMKQGSEVDMLFQSLAGSEKANDSFGINVAMIDEADAIQKEKSSSTGPDRFYFETGEGAEDSSDAGFGTDQATMESRCYGFARRYPVFVIDTVMGFIGAEYINDRQQHLRCGIEDMFLAKLQDINIGQDSCYVVSMDMDQSDNEDSAMVLINGGTAFIIGIPQGDDPMLMYQSMGYHDVAALQQLTNRPPVPVFTKWMEKWGLWEDGHLTPKAGDASIFMDAWLGK